jgi:hypothetical protein
MAVNVHRHRDRGVTEPLLDRLRVRAELDEQRGASVSEVVKPKPGGKTRLPDSRLEVTQS